MTPLEAGTAAAGFVGLAVHAFNGCIIAYEWIQTARRMDQEADTIRSKLLWQQRRLSDWGKRIGIQSNPLKDRVDWELASNLLKEQNEHLTSAAKLKAKYHLDIGEEEWDNAKFEDKSIGQSTLGELLARVEQTLPGKSTTQSLSKPNPFKCLQWAMIGKKQAAVIVQDISEINDRLHLMLDSKDREWTRLCQEALLRNLICISDTPVELEAVQQLLKPQEPRIKNRIVAAAELKRSISIVRDRAPIKPRKKLELTCIKSRKLGPVGKSLLVDSGVVMGSFQRQQVLIEWRITDEEDWVLLKPHMEDLAVLLTSMDRDSFLVLPVKGLVRDKVNRYALVYDLSLIPGDKAGDLKMTSLHQLISEGYKASLTCRLVIALRLAEALLQFHTAGWLHKGIRSDNIVFVSAADAGPETILEGNAYLIGFEHARPDSEIAESLTRLPNMSLNSELYRHPLARGIERQPFTKHFDLYSLGCVLLELSRWEKLAKIHPGRQDLDDQMRRSEENAEVMKLPSLVNWGTLTQEVSSVEYAAGQVFAGVVALCFDGEASHKPSPPLDVQQKVVDKLRSCHF